MSAVAEPVTVHVMDARKPQPFLSFNAGYLVRPDAAPDDLLNDAGCWLEAATDTVNTLALELGSNGSLLQQNGALAGSIAYGAYHLLTMVKGAVEAAQVAMAKESNRGNAA